MIRPTGSLEIKLNMNDSAALPCSVFDPTKPSKVCGRPAWIAWAWPQEGGLWTVQPICAEHLRSGQVAPSGR